MTLQDKTQNRNALHVDASAKVENNSRFADRLMKVIPLQEGASVLEVGCGGAELSRVLRDRYRLDCYGIEPFPIYSPCIDPDRVRLGVAEEIPFDSGLFDLVAVKDVLEHVDSVERSIDELLRVSKKYVYIMCPNYAFPYEAHFKVPFPPFFPKPLAKLYLRLFGFNAVQIEFINHINYVTKAGLHRMLRRSARADEIYAVVDLQLSKKFRQAGVISTFFDRFANDKIELLVIKR